MTKKFKKNKKLDIYLSVKFVCDSCGFIKIIPQSEFIKVTNESFINNKLFICDNCNIRMRQIGRAHV